MGVCLSCLGLRRNDEDESQDRSRLLYDELGANHGYGTWGASNVPAQNVMNPEEARREQEALDNITRWASDQIVEIFPHQHKSLMTMSTSQINGHSETGGPSSSSHHDILLSLIPGDKSKRSIRIYPASRPTSKDAQSLRSKNSFGGLNGASVKSKDSSVLVTLDVDLP
ncbi:hypothetical protein PV08_06354 [Exophiala spinifera]|uniref:Late endosomal/lysosomal adaptor and MAPK and MTOR activator 1 n=1 Tax=Exophiala spinifera TaxID=91928 RepID=A0A0D2BBB4_9EURO|nr:uncharacterized protein PV08_06354 [Exophiala spinifera]KIW16303.1 hypothetical protein PV08_06354 [Exophiala spinifera]